MNKIDQLLYNDVDQSYIIEIEDIIISCVLNNDADIDEIFLHLSPKDFIKPENRIIFKIAIDFRENNEPIDFIAIADYISNDSDLSIHFKDHKRYLLDLSSSHTYSKNLEQYIEIIKNSSIKRSINSFAEELKNTDLDLINANEKLWELEKEFSNIAGSKKGKQISSIQEIIEEFHKKLELIKEQSDDIQGVRTGYSNIDNLTNGFHNGDLVILAARPGIGKTTLAINFLLNIAKNLKFKNEENSKNEKKQKPQCVLMFSIEMGKDQICQRLLTNLSHINPMRKDLNQTEELSIMVSSTELKKLPIYVDDSSDLTLLDMQSKIKQLSNTMEIKLIVLDYLQLLKLSDSNRRGFNRQQEVSEISRTLKKLARQFNVPIISIAQLSRRIEERKGGPNARPMLSDLRESGSIEQDADMVCFLSYIDDNPEEAEDDKNLESQLKSKVHVEFILAKNRNGQTGICELIFDKTINTYFEKNNKH
ncbi:replicative DNA helicase [Malacoplasma penetrans HF-2]|uniref:Replicative DNA helicase n=1 Tax=Malacoplasma penetrans (strain HF-2) TaxID=272633 RepID=Q8EWJ8_MALP2|nr:replicative DNA helicase [Malacoplasma penetrans]BAC43996.1 replicative DNA helicase [Malacoplasma penetrans HF-2]